MTVFVTPANERDAILMAPTLRRSDVDELQAVSYEDPQAILTQSVEVSDLAWTAWLDGWPIAMFGVSPVLPLAVGGAWLLATDHVERVKRSAWELSVKHVAIMHTRYPVLLNWVDERNITSRQWLRKLGFEALRREAFYGVERRPFLLYVSTKHV